MKSGRSKTKNRSNPRTVAFKRSGSAARKPKSGSRKGVTRSKSADAEDDEEDYDEDEDIVTGSSPKPSHVRQVSHVSHVSHVSGASGASGASHGSNRSDHSRGYDTSGAPRQKGAGKNKKKSPHAGRKHNTENDDITSLQSRSTMREASVESVTPESSVDKLAQYLKSGAGWNKQIGIEIFQDIDQMWLEYTYNHVGPTLPSPYEYDVFDSKNNRVFQVRPVYTTSGVFEREKHNIGKPTKGFGAPNEFSCHSNKGLKVCYFTFATRTVKLLCRQSIPELKMDIFVQGMKVGRVSQKRRTISMKTEAADVMEIQQVPPPGGRCNKMQKHNNFECNIYLIGELSNIQIGVIGRNGINEDSVVMGHPLGFYCDFSKIQENEEARGVFSNLHRVFLLAVTVGFMTLYTSLKLR